MFRRLPSRADLESLLDVAARAYGVADPGRVVAAPGTQILIETLPRLRLRSRVAVVGPTYGEHEAAWLRGGHDVTLVSDPAEAGEADVVVVVNPNNPDGRTWEAAGLLDLAGRLAARGGWLVVDEAFIDLERTESLAPYPMPGLVVLRSFGKTYGLAGIRLGFALAEPPLAETIAQALGPWAVPGPALAIGRAALADTSWLHDAGAARHADAMRLDRLLVQRGGRVIGGTCLFRTAVFPEAPGLFRRLGEAGIYVRRFEENRDWLRFGLPADKGEWCRLSRVLKPA